MNTPLAPARYTHTNQHGTYELVLTDLHKLTSEGKTTVSYTLRKEGGPVIFQGADLHPGMGIPPTGPVAASHLLAFLTLRPGDTDDEYFDDYTSEQMAFRDSEAEDLWLWQAELTPEEFGGD